MITGLTLAVAAGEAFLLLVLLVLWIRERGALAEFVRAAQDPERLKATAARVPSAYRPAAVQFASELAKKGSLDELLVAAITRAVQASEGALWSSVLVRILALSGALSPLVVALLGASSEIGRAIPSREGTNPSRAFLAAREALGPVFLELQEAAESSALLVAGLALLFALDWLLRRPEAREARFVHAVLRAAMTARPAAAAPVAARLSELLSPERSLRLPITAMGFFFVSVGLGWTFLVATAGVREANAEDIYRVWPKGHQKAIRVSSQISAPVASGGGRPIQDNLLPTLSIGSESVEIAGHTLTSVKDGRLPAGWQNQVEGVADLETFKQNLPSNQLEVAVLCHRPMAIGTVLEVLSFLQKTHGLATANLVVERHVRLDGEAKVKVHAALPLRLARADQATPLSAQIEASRVRLEGGVGEPVDIELDGEGWKRELAVTIRARSSASDPRTEPEIAIQKLDPSMTCERLAEILSAADSICETGPVDCGVPGLGLTFRYAL